MAREIIASLAAEYENQLEIYTSMRAIALRQSEMCAESDFSAEYHTAALDSLLYDRDLLREKAGESREKADALTGALRNELRLGRLTSENLAELGYPAEAQKLREAINCLDALLKDIATLDEKSKNSLLGRMAHLREDLRGIQRQKRARRAYRTAAIPPQGYYFDKNSV